MERVTAQDLMMVWPERLGWSQDIAALMLRTRGLRRRRWMRGSPGRCGHDRADGGQHRRARPGPRAAGPRAPSRARTPTTPRGRGGRAARRRPPGRRASAPRHQPLPRRPPTSPRTAGALSRRRGPRPAASATTHRSSRHRVPDSATCHARSGLITSVSWVPSSPRSTVSPKPSVHDPPQVSRADRQLCAPAGWATRDGSYGAA